VSSSYVRLGADPVRERPAGDFVIGVRAFGVVTDMVPATVARLDEQSLEQLEVGAVAVEVSAGASRAALDSLGRVLENRRRSGTDVVVVLRDVPSSAADSAAVASIARRTWASTLVLSGPWESMPLDRLTLAMERRAASARAAGRPGLQVALAVTADEPTRHAWAAERESGIDEVVLVLTSASSGADPLGRQLATWSAWIAETGALRNYWVYGTGAAPAAHGASSQRMAMRGVLAWATSERKVRGAILGPVSDLGALNGLRTTSYAWRPAAGAVLQAGRSIRESRAPAVAPAPVDSAVP
jgi:hypothetical protein